MQRGGGGGGVEYPHTCIHTFPQVAKQSKAAMSMCLWVRAMDTYGRVVKIVEPKRLMLREAQVGGEGADWGGG